MRIKHALIGLLLFSSSLLLAPARAHAGPEVTFTLGALIGDSLRDVLQVRPNNLAEGFDNAPIFGGRLGYTAFPFAIEGSITYSPSAISIAGGDSIDATLVYAEAEVQLLVLPGPVAPFVSAGLGMHSIQLKGGAVPRETVPGYLVGGGVKATVGTLGLRVDVKDHITPLKVANLSPQFLQATGLAVDTNLHNVEFSGGITIKF